MNREKISNYALICLGLVAGGILLFACVKYVLPVLSPFIIAWLVAATSYRPAARLSAKLKLPERIVRLLASLLLVILAAAAVALAVWQITEAVWRFLMDIGEGSAMYDLLNRLTGPGALKMFDGFPDELAARISSAVEGMLTQALSLMASGVTGVVGALPGVFFFLLVTVVALVYFALDYDRINQFLHSLLPEKTFARLTALGQGILTVLKKYICSYSLILLITFATMLAGFLILRIEQAVTLAILVSLLDILPVIGVGTVLIPWGIFELATGNSFLGVGLIILFVVNAIIRQICEPKIVGKSLDLHPIVSLILLYVGYALFGLVGMIILPVAAVAVGVLLKGDKSAQVG